MSKAWHQLDDVFMQCMEVPVHMLAFHDEPNLVRKVKLRNQDIGAPIDKILEAVFHFGQNEAQPIPGICSVSVGDVVELNGTYHMVAAEGFREMPKAEFDDYKAHPRRERWAWQR